MLKTPILVLAVFALAGFLVYSVAEYKKSGIERRGLVTCAEKACFWSAHMHLFAPVEICGEKYRMPKFKGPLAGNHTHADENLLHWHDKIPYDSEKKAFIGEAPFRLEKVFRDLGLEVTENRLLGKKDGNACGSAPGAWKALVNGRTDPDWRRYEWQDGDVVFFVFDGRSAAEAEEAYRKNPLKFPKVTPE